MAVTLQVQLTDAQQALMVQIANSVLPPGHTVADKLAWATQVAKDGLAAEVARLGVEEIDQTLREATNSQRSEFLAGIKNAWPDPVEPEPEV